MTNPIRLIVEDYGWIHRGIGLFGNLAFLVGSVLFLPSYEQWKTTGVWLFMIGAAAMFVGALGQFLVNLGDGQD